MKIDKKETYTLISADEESFKDFYKNFKNTLLGLDNNHIILELSVFENLKTEDFLLFLDIAKQKRENGTSFAIVNKMANADDYPESFNIVPTITEAEDILEMEAIERELGF